MCVVLLLCGTVENHTVETGDARDDLMPCHAKCHGLFVRPADRVKGSRNGREGDKEVREGGATDWTGASQCERTNQPSPCWSWTLLTCVNPSYSWRAPAPSASSTVAHGRTATDDDAATAHLPPHPARPGPVQPQHPRLHTRRLVNIFCSHSHSTFLSWRREETG